MEVAMGEENKTNSVKQTLVCEFTAYQVEITDKGAHDDKCILDKNSIVITISGCCRTSEITLENTMELFLAEYRGRKTNSMDLISDDRKGKCYGYLPVKDGIKERVYADSLDKKNIHVTRIVFGEKQIKPAGDDRRVAIDFYTGDFRRIVADAFWGIYNQCSNMNNDIEDLKIESITFNKGNDSSITFEIDSESTKYEINNCDNGYVSFWGKSGNDLKRIGFPICLKKADFTYEDDSACLYYELSNPKRKLEYYKSCAVITQSQKESPNCKDDYQIMLFSGEDEELGKGIFYYYKDELYPKIVVKDSIIKAYDVRYHFYNNGEQKIIFNSEFDNTNDDLKEIIRNCEENKTINYENLEKSCRDKAFCEYGKNINGFKLGDNDEFSKKMEKGENCSFILSYEGVKLENALESDYIWREKKDTIKISFNIDSDDASDVKIKKGGIGDCFFVYRRGGKILISTKISYVRYKKLWDSKLEELINSNIKIGEPFNKQLDFVEKNWEKIKKIVDELVSLIKNPDNKLIVESLMKESCSENEFNIKKLEKKLFNGLTPNRAVANQVYDEVKKWEKAKEENKKTKIPNFVIMGAPGTGKTTIAKRIADCFFDGDKIDNNLDKENKILQLSPSDLKGAYVGQTIPKVYDYLVEASKSKKILFLDEAYLLQEDQFGREALAYLLPIMNGDRTVIFRMKEDKEESFDFEKEDHIVPPIWMAGYEHQMRRTLSENPGLYRRMVKLVLPSPIASALYNNLQMLAKDNKELMKKFDDSSNDIKSYFTWAIARENAEYFGNYAGVQKFFETCEVREVGKSDNAGAIINRIIEESKKEIKAQYVALLSKDEKSRKFIVSRDIDTTFDDVIGGDVKGKLKPIVNMLINHEDYCERGINVPKGALLAGPPGTGKTHLARAVAGEFQKELVGKSSDKQIAFISVLGTELRTPELVEKLFAEADDYDAAIIFIDEIDSIGTKREYSSNPEPMFQLLKEMDGFEQRTNIFVMAATNAPESLDEALKRPGRFDRYIEVSYPTKDDREKIIGLYVKKLAWAKNALSDDKNGTFNQFLGAIADATKSFTPAQLQNLINEAAIDFNSPIPSVQLQNLINEAAKKAQLQNLINEAVEKTQLQNDVSTSAQNNEIIESGIDGLKLENQIELKIKINVFEILVKEKIEQLKIGDKKPKSSDDNEFSFEENKGCSAVAIHEVGHAMVCLLQDMEPFEKITIMPRGNALGYVIPSSNNSLWTKKDYLNQIRVFMGGRVAEELFYGDDISVGAAQDIQSATKLAEDMVAIYGMSEKIGIMAVKNDSTNFLGSDSRYDCSETFRYDVELEVRNLLRTQLEIVREELKKQKDIIEKMAKKVYDKETMTGEEFKKEFENINKTGSE